MKRAALVLTMAVAWCGISRATLPTWNPIAPGAGGNFYCAEVNSAGRAFVGSDNSGMYVSNAFPYNSWSRIGALDGLAASQIWSISFCPSNPSKGYAATGTGLYKTSDSGGTWSKVTDSFFSALVDAEYVSWKDSANVAFAWSEAASPKLLHLTVSQDAGSTWTTWGTIEGDTSRVSRLMLKGDGNGEDLLAVIGKVGTNGVVPDTAKHDFWVLWDKAQFVNPVHYRNLHTFSGHDTTLDILDAIWASDTTDDMVVTLANDSHSASSGSVAVSSLVSSLSIGDWKLQHTDSQNKVTGALWRDGSYFYVLNVAANYGSAHGGLWRSPTDFSSGWSRIQDNTKNEVGWAQSYDNAYGQTLTNAPKSISRKGELWVTASYVWSDSAHYKYKKSFSTGTSYHNDSSPWNSTQIDNVNAACEALDGSGNLWVGFYDIGLWEYSGGAWYDRNNNASPSWTGDDGIGGNITSILIDGSTIYVTADSSSKASIGWRVWKSTSGGASWSTGGTGLSDQHYLRSLCKDGSNYYVTMGGEVYRATDPLGSWSKKSPASDTHCYSVSARSGTVLAAGDSLWRSADNGDHWTKVFNLRTGSCRGSNTSKLQQEDWNGIHNFAFNEAQQAWFASDYIRPIDIPCTGDTLYGVLASTDDGASWSRISAKDQIPCCRYVLPDSCGLRFLVCTGSSLSNGVDNEAEWEAERGLLIGRYHGGTSGTFEITDQVYSGSIGSVTASASTGYRNPTATAVATRTGNGGSTYYAYVVAQGYGVMLTDDIPVPDESQCGTERTGGRGAMAAQQSREEGPPNIGRRVFTVEEAISRVQSGELELFDVSGRRSSQPAPGIYFSVTRDKAGAIIARRTVLVTR